MKGNGWGDLGPRNVRVGPRTVHLATMLLQESVLDGLSWFAP